MLISAFPDDLCLAYVNTLSWRGTDQPKERLATMGDLLSWLGEAAGLERSAVRKAGDWMLRHPKLGTAVFTDAIGMREILFGVFSALASDRSPSDKDISALNTTLARAPQRTALVAAKSGFAWRIERPEMTCPCFLAPVLWSATDLLTRARHLRIRQCENDACLWLFIDESKNGTRRWCDMASCGNRAKARRHYLRSKQA